MRYQQIFATFSISRKLDVGIKRGVIWHTQGSGKTVLAFHNVEFLTTITAGKVSRRNFILSLTDWNFCNKPPLNLENTGLKSMQFLPKKFVEVIQNVGNFTNTSKLSISVVNIQKFSAASIAKESDFNVNIQRIYFIDEAHRDYKFDGSFLARLMSSDKNAVMVALTGTPLIGEFKTREIFGGYIHCYYYDKSIDDGYTLPLIREEIKSAYKLKLQYTLKKLHVKKGSLDADKIFSHKNFVLPLVDYIESDFTQIRIILDDSTIGAMVVCYYSEQARAVAKELKQRGKFKTELILYDEENLADKRNDFKSGTVDILVVYQMLLTGFDAPRLKKLYLGRKIKEHNLLQALTRVNRPYKNLRYGYVVDFADIQAEFDKTNQACLQELKLELGADFDTFNTPAEIERDLNFVKNKLSKFIIDKTIPNFPSTSVIKNIEIELPPLVEQKKIGSFLYSLDEKISLNKKINSTLEEMARTIYLQKVFHKAAKGKIGDIIIENPKSTISVGDAKNSGGEILFFTSGKNILRRKEKLVDGRNIF